MRSMSGTVRHLLLRFGPWAGHKYFLDKMTLRDLVRAYFTHYAILSYIVLGTALSIYAVMTATSFVGPAIAAALVLPVYPLVWYVLHRFLLHGRLLYKFPATASLWKRIHFDHHSNPHDLGVLFGALYTTLPTIAVVTLPLGWAIAGPAGAAAALASGIFVTCFYEFCHCIEHLPFTPRWQWLKRMKRQHLAHHFHSEQGNFGITNFFWDRALGTFYAHPRDISRSATVFNLGYTDEQADEYPWVRKLSEGDPEFQPLERTLVENGLAVPQR